MLKKTKQLAAFTLLECLVALLVLSGGLLVFDGLSRLMRQEVHYQTQSRQKDWLVFSEQLRTELETARLVKVENNRLYVDKKGQALAFGQSKSDDFRKTNNKGQGYQPMVYGVSTSNISQTEQLVRIDVVFEDGLERTFLYDFSEKR
ncbi:competence protein ComGF [Streptococcus minor]|uniref:Competence protein ComGF n=1 Tax=Streptococcus minor TaxID=229549 RepID=A0A3P1V7U7_9STRE|nr:competence type IV pilus minor pilin ComGF [Streptococcus minor]RRD29868.1 competence protein ComGF [Streptococcus minor]